MAHSPDMTEKVLKAMLTLCLLGNFSCFLSSADFFKINFFLKKILSGISSEYQTVWDPDQALHFVGYQQMTLVSRHLAEFKHPTY